MTKSRLRLHITKRINKTVDNFSFIKEPPKWTFAIFVLIYSFVYFFIVKSARTPGTVNFMGMQIPYSIFTGAFSSLGNIILILMVIFYKKLGLLFTFLIIFIQFPLLIVQMTVSHVTNSIPGLFSNIFLFIACSLIFINNSVIEKYQKKIHDHAVTDELTGLPNRFACTGLMENFAKRNYNFTIVSIDLNNFKSINDTMGHEVGDKVLKEIANRWKALSESGTTKTTDFVARLSGDEFALIIRGYKFKGEILNTINAYKNELEKTITIDNCDYFMTACFGCAEYPIDTDNISTLFSCADAAMHQVKKQNGGLSVLRYTPDLLETEQSLEIERKIRIALDTDSVYFNLQPQFDMDKNLRGFEALARIKDTNGNVIMPSQFIKVAEKTGLIDRIDMRVFSKAAKFLAEVMEKGNKDLVLSFNVSVKHLMKNNFLDEIKEVIRNTKISPKNLELEITESIMIDSAEKALGRINEVKEFGIQVAIDDFGTGYSSLSYLNKLPSDMLKIDKSFIDTMNKNESSKKYVASIVSIGHILNLKVISEGVEHPEQLETLRSIGCDFIQGYLWGKPLPPEEAAKLVEA